MKRRLTALVAGFAVGVVTVGVMLAVMTARDVLPLPATLEPASTDVPRPRLVDRNGVPLNTTYTGEWNVDDQLPLHEIPPFLREAFIHAEDKRFRSHHGADWLARLAAVADNLRELDTVRGASTISEQTVRMLHPRPRSFWSRWLAGVEAGRLEDRFSKDEILEFYLNQVPYASNRRGVRQAAELYFGRDLNTLSDREMLLLAVLVRAPSALDPRRNPQACLAAIDRLNDALLARGVIDPARHAAIAGDSIRLQTAALTVAAPHFLAFASGQAAARQTATGPAPARAFVTTLDASLQMAVQKLLDTRLEALASLDVHNGAVLVVDNASGDVLAWVVAGGGDPDGPESHIDPIVTPRQPGSAMKPLLYAFALEQGHTLADVIVDAPLSESIGDGLHRYRNYSERYYGEVTLREALANSLNIPALKLVHAVGADAYLAQLERMGIASLREHPDVYGDGLALGNGEVTLFELVQAWRALANRGLMSELAVLRDAAHTSAPEQRVLSAETAALIGHVLSDPDARSAEFGRDSVLNLPVQTAVKTGTSSDYRDAWTLGFDARFTVGIWMGNLDRTPTRGVTGAIGPALLLRSVFALLNRDGNSRPLYLSPRLMQRQVCVPSPRIAAGGCITRNEWFDPAPDHPAGTDQPSRSAATTVATAATPVRLRQPTQDLELAFDPRLPASAQAYRFLLDGIDNTDAVTWTIDGDITEASGNTLIWPVTRGEHQVAATIHRDGILIAEVTAVEFRVR